MGCPKGSTLVYHALGTDPALENDDIGSVEVDCGVIMAEIIQFNMTVGYYTGEGTVIGFNRDFWDGQVGSISPNFISGKYELAQLEISAYSGLELTARFDNANWEISLGDIRVRFPNAPAPDNGWFILPPSDGNYVGVGTAGLRSYLIANDGVSIPVEITYRQADANTADPDHWLTVGNFGSEYGYDTLIPIGGLYPSTYRGVSIKQIFINAALQLLFAFSDESQYEAANKLHITIEYGYGETYNTVFSILSWDGFSYIGEVNQEMYDAFIGAYNNEDQLQVKIIIVG